MKLLKSVCSNCKNQQHFLTKADLFVTQANKIFLPIQKFNQPGPSNSKSSRFRDKIYLTAALICGVSDFSPVLMAN